jgi:hypothetical protein
MEENFKWHLNISAPYTDAFIIFSKKRDSFIPNIYRDTLKTFA